MRDSSLADGLERRLHPAFIAADRVSWWITIAVVFSGGVLAMLIVWLSSAAEGFGLLLIGAALAAVVALLILGAVTLPRIAYRHTSYVVSPLGLEIRRGVLWRRVVTLPRSRVQHTDVVQGPVARRYGLATLVVHTAGTENATVALQGIGRAEAFALRDLLVRGGERDGV